MSVVINGVQLPRLAGGSQEADAAQAGADQGADGGGFVDNYLTNVPEDYRPHVEPYLRSIESNANERFREHAEFRDTWSPYGEIEYEGNTYNLADYEPEGLAQLLAFAELMSDPDEFKNWWESVGQQAGFYQQALDNDDDDFDLDDDGEFEGLSVDDIRSAVSELLDERLSPFEQRAQEQQLEADEQAAAQAIDTTMDQLREQFGEFDEQAVYRFAYAHADSAENPILAGFQDYQQFAAQIENGTINDKLGQPIAPEPGGGPANTNEKPPSDFAEAKKMAMERLAQMR